MAETKITKREYYGMVREVVEASEAENKADVLAFIDHEVELLDAKAAKAAKRAADKKAEGDELRAVVESILTDELQTADSIAAQVEGEDVTKQKVVARLTQLVKAGVAVKDTVKVDSRKLVAYRLATDTDVVAE